MALNSSGRTACCTAARHTGHRHDLATAVVHARPGNSGSSPPRRSHSDGKRERRPLSAQCTHEEDSHCQESTGSVPTLVSLCCMLWCSLSLCLLSLRASVASAPVPPSGVRPRPIDECSHRHQRTETHAQQHQHKRVDGAAEKTAEHGEQQQTKRKANGSGSGLWHRRCTRSQCCFWPIESSTAAIRVQWSRSCPLEITRSRSPFLASAPRLSAAARPSPLHVCGGGDGACAALATTG